jgi:hypothetical protein
MIVDEGLGAGGCAGQQLRFEKINPEAACDICGNVSVLLSRLKISSQSEGSWPKIFVADHLFQSCLNDEVGHKPSALSV